LKGIGILLKFEGKGGKRVSLSWEEKEREEEQGQKEARGFIFTKNEKGKKEKEEVFLLSQRGEGEKGDGPAEEKASDMAKKREKTDRLHRPESEKGGKE